MSNTRLLLPTSTVFFECDIQTKLSPHIFRSATMAHNAKRFTQLGQILGVPIVATRHVHKSFGDIESVIGSVTHPGRKVFDKTQFSMLTEEVLDHLNRMRNVDTVVLYGAETHICVK